jgi:hypothetical protein
MHASVDSIITHFSSENLISVIPKADKTWLNNPVKPLLGMTRASSISIVIMDFS